MRTTDVVIIGAGQAGLAASHCLQRRGIEHVVLERGRVAERWRSERWDSLRLLTPNWMSRLPGFAYRGADAGGFMSMAQVVDFFERYAALGVAPVHAHTRVLTVQPHAVGFRVQTDRGDFVAPEVVIATGQCDVPVRPVIAQRLSRHTQQVAPAEYRNPEAIPPGNVLVVGASATGVQIAEELARSGREVTLAVGRHTRVPRRYRGADIMWWLERIGALSEKPDEVDDLDAALAQPSLQLIGSDPARNLDLPALARAGVRLCGRLVDVLGTRLEFADDLPRSVQAAERKLARLLARIDRFANVLRGLGRPLSEDFAERVRPSSIDPQLLARAPTVLDLRAERIGSVIWATGYRRDYGFLRLPILDACGEIVQLRGLTPAPGLYTLGLRFQSTRKSTFIDGVAADAEFVTARIAARLGFRESDAA